MAGASSIPTPVTSDLAEFISVVNPLLAVAQFFIFSIAVIETIVASGAELSFGSKTKILIDEDHVKAYITNGLNR